MAPRYQKKAKKAYKKALVRSLRPTIKRVINSRLEKKWFQHQAADQTMSSTWQRFSFFDPTAGTGAKFLEQGLTANDRIGDKVFIVGITFKAVMRPLPAMDTSGCICRLAVYHNKEARGALPSVAQVWDNDTATYAIMANRNQPYHAAVTIKRDILTSGVQTIAQSTGAATGAGPTQLVSMYIPINKRLDLTGDTGYIADLIKDDWGIFHVCSDATGMTMAVNYTVHFTDA